MVLVAVAGSVEQVDDRDRRLEATLWVLVLRLDGQGPFELRHHRLERFHALGDLRIAQADVASEGSLAVVEKVLVGLGRTDDDLQVAVAEFHPGDGGCLIVVGAEGLGGDLEEGLEPVVDGQFSSSVQVSGSELQSFVFFGFGVRNELQRTGLLLLTNQGVGIQEEVLLARVELEPGVAFFPGETHGIEGSAGILAPGGREDLVLFATVPGAVHHLEQFSGSRIADVLLVLEAAGLGPEEVAHDLGSLDGLAERRKVLFGDLVLRHAQFRAGVVVQNGLDLLSSVAGGDLGLVSVVVGGVLRAAEDEHDGQKATEMEKTMHCRPPLRCRVN